MFVYFDRNKCDQKTLYFHLKSIFSLYHYSDGKNDHAGIYAIYNDKEHCHYVGQSRNLPSRIATHLSGKYGNGKHRVDIYLAVENGFSDFSERSLESQKAILDNNEKGLMSILKPTENIVADFDLKLNKDRQFIVFDGLEEVKNSSSLEICVNEDYLLVTNSPESFSQAISAGNYISFSSNYRMYEEEYTEFCKYMEGKQHA